MLDLLGTELSGQGAGPEQETLMHHLTISVRGFSTAAISFACFLVGCAGSDTTGGQPSMNTGASGGGGTSGADGSPLGRAGTVGDEQTNGGSMAGAGGAGGAPPAGVAGSGTAGGGSSGGLGGSRNAGGTGGLNGAGAPSGGQATAGAAGSTAMGGSPGSGGSSATGDGRLTHPGILNNARELAAIKDKVAARAEPWASAFARLNGSAYASLAYAEKPYAVVECGSYNKPNIGCSQMVDDGMAAYAHALVWNATGSAMHAAKAVEIIDAWSKVYRQNLQSNSRLVVAWATPWYANAAEILRYSYAGWTPDIQQRFSRLLHLWLPYVNTDDPPLANWIESRIEAHMAVAVFLDDPAELAKAVARWKQFLPTYVLDNGLCSETCRDLGHTGLGIRSLLYAAETAWQQGIDLFAPNQARLAKFIELHGTWMLGQEAVPSTVCGGTILAAENDAVGIGPPSGGGRMPLEILYAQLHDRLHVPLPNLREMIQGARPFGGGHWVLKWETLTHAVPL